MAKQPGEKQRFEVLLEQVRKEVQISADGHVALDQKVDRLNRELSEQVDTGFASMDIKFDTVLSEVRSVAKQVQEHAQAHTS